MQNIFQLFDLPLDFQVDNNELSTRYLRLQRALHPDNFAAKSEQEQRLALQQSAQINDAYEKLKDHILRAEALVEIGTQQEIDKENTIQDLTFLMQQMELREQLESIEQSQDEAALAELQQTLTQVNSQELTELQQSLQAQQWQQAKLHIDRLKFVKKLEQEIERIEEAIFDF
ncbi:co-chaperone protein HscB [Cricetibacter osteomyelitidis]|uniref:Co-chaperone protein HscB homolog n=1 Tax=Cricetibacter osteomyelitidis TaxID=1521931 RepID=A0A4V2T0L4_9PAST|nr:Fe-S protein assembly co-chaperone HscB [Cricetibacter osteomyelitidis]TCP90113.1 co-chaperone protein HscB [Cricetibacter osteomyelitidis]